MSLIGPRPLLPQDQPANSTSRLVVRPGITGWAFAAYDQQLEKELGGESANLRAISSVVRTIDAPKFNDRFSAVRSAA